MWTSILRPQMSIITVTKIWQIKFQKIDQCTGQIGADSIRASAEDLHKYGRPTKYSRWSLSEKQQYWHKLIRQRVKIVFKKIRNGSVANQPQEKNWQSKIGRNIGEFVVALLYFHLFVLCFSQYRSHQCKIGGDDWLCEFNELGFCSSSRNQR